MVTFKDRQIKALHKHLYQSEGTSVCDPVLQVFWDWLFRFVPPSWSATSLTTFGFIINLTTTGIMIYFNPDGTAKVPSWVYMSCALGVFSYLTFDALDGKQARRTRDCPLEEFFDHGFDSFSTVCIVLGVCFALRLGQGPIVLLVLMGAAQLSCYMSVWQKYVTGIMKFGRVDVNEGNLAVSFIHIVCAFAPTVFDTTIPGFNVTVRYIFVTSTLVLSFHFVLRQFLDITSNIQKKSPGSKRFSITAVYPLMPVGLGIGLQLMISVMTPMYTDHLCLYLITFGIVVSKITLNLIVADITKDEVPVFDWILVGPAALALTRFTSSPFTEHISLWIVCICSLMSWVFYFCTVVREFCRHLNMYCFHITRKPSPNSRMSLG